MAIEILRNGFWLAMPLINYHGHVMTKRQAQEGPEQNSIVNEGAIPAHAE
jgi:hypothetical protein